MLLPANIRYLIIHTSDSKWGTVEAIREWHTLPPPKGRGWADIGYHYVITNQYPTYNNVKNNQPDDSYDGKFWPGRPINEIGAHCLGYNDKSLGICLVGVHGVYTPKQLETLSAACLRLMDQYKIPVEHVLGHYETASGKAEGKTCPDMDMSEVREHLSSLQRIHAQMAVPI